MQTERTWTLDALLLLGSEMMICYALGMIMPLTLGRLSPDLPVLQRQFAGFVINSLFVQGGGLLVAHVFLRRHEVGWGEFLGLRGPETGRAIVYGVITAALALPGVLLLKELVAYLLTLLQGPAEDQGVVRMLLVHQSPGQRIFFGAVALLLAPIGEEALFRGILYRCLKQLGGPRLALVSSSLFFGMVHLNIVALVPLSCLGVVLALLYDKTRNLLAPIVAHAVFNAVNFFFILHPL